MSTELALPVKTIVPKPTKNEIISAMVEIAREKFVAERDALFKIRDDLQAKIDRRYEKAFKAALKSVKFSGVSFTYSHRPEVYIGTIYLEADEESERLQQELKKSPAGRKDHFRRIKDPRQLAQPILQYRPPRRPGADAS